MPIEKRLVPTNALEVLPGLLEWESQDGYTCFVLNWRAVTDSSLNLKVENDYLESIKSPLFLESCEDYFLKVVAPKMGGVDSPLFQQEYENNWAAKTKSLSAFYAFEFNFHTKNYAGKIPNCPVHVCIDFGFHHPCVMICQQSKPSSGEYSASHFYYFHDVLRGMDVPLEKFIDTVVEYLNFNFPNCEHIWFTVQEGDTPGGSGITDKSGNISPVQVLMQKGIYPKPRVYSQIGPRVDLCNKKLSESFKGRPLFNFNPACKDWMDMLEGGYRRERIIRFGTVVPSIGYFKDGYHDHLADAWGAWVVCNFHVPENKVKRIAKKQKPRRRITL